MRAPRRVLLVLVASTLCVPAIAAHATVTKKHRPKPVCKLVTDRSGDAKGTGTALTTPSSDANLDIISADVATNATTLTGVVRVSKLATSDSTAPAGWQYQVVFSVGGYTDTVEVVVGPSGTSWNGGKGTGKIDAAKKEVRISVPLRPQDCELTEGRGKASGPALDPHGQNENNRASSLPGVGSSCGTSSCWRGCGRRNAG